MRIIFFGRRKITTDAIKYVLDLGHEVALVITHDAERDRIYGPLVSEFCEMRGIPNIRFDGKIDPEIIKAAKPDIIFSLYYSKIIKQDILDIPPLGCINVHPAMLPVGRGPAPTMWNVLRGDKFAGATIHYMVEDVDAGDIIDQKVVKINGRTGFQLNWDLMEVCFDLLKKNFQSICDGTNSRIPQNHDEAEYCLPFKTSIRFISWGDPDAAINNIKAFTKPYEGALTHTAKDELVLIWKGHKLSKRISLKPPGYFELTSDGILVQTNTLPILITEYDIINTLRNKGRFVSGPPVAEDKYPSRH